MKTNVSIKFSSIEEYREIEKKLEEIGYVNDKGWNERKKNEIGYVYLSEDLFYTKFKYKDEESYTYNSLEEFLKDE